MPVQYIVFFVALGLVILSASDAKFNFLLSKDQTERLLGLSAEVKYVQDNKINRYATQFEVLLPVNVSKLKFTWFSTNNDPIKYSMEIKNEDPEALEPPKLNISSNGMVPFKRSVFQVSLVCTGMKTAEVGFDIILNVTIPRAKDVSTLVLRRIKICLKKKIKEQIMDEKSPIWKDSDIKYPKTPNSKNSSKRLKTNARTNGTGTDIILEIAKILVQDKEQSIKRQRNQEEEEFDVDEKENFIEKHKLLIIIGSASGFLLLLILSMSACYIRSKKTHRSETARSTVQSNHRPNAQSQTLLRIETPNVASSCGNVSIGTLGNSTLRKNPSIITTSTEARSANINQLLASISINREMIVLEEIVREGTFGQTIRGSVIINNRKEPILVKTVSDQASHNQIGLLLREGMQLFAMSHINILKIMAVCVDDPSRPLLIYPYILPGNLKTFLQSCKISPDSHSHKLSTQNGIFMAIQIVQAITYLHRKNIIHRDLATRNCVVDHELVVRITDSALSRDLFPNDYHCLGDSENRPVKWLAIESLSRKIFSQSSDVWAFGVILWELMTRGMQPYAEIDPFEMEAYLREEYRLQQPNNCPDELYTLMRCCWATKPEDRPFPQQLDKYLQEFFTTLNGFI